MTALLLCRVVDTVLQGPIMVHVLSDEDLECFHVLAHFAVEKGSLIIKSILEQTFQHSFGIVMGRSFQ